MKAKKKYYAKYKNSILAIKQLINQNTPPPPPDDPPQPESIDIPPPPKINLKKIIIVELVLKFDITLTSKKRS